mgnify:FL=1
MNMTDLKRAKPPKEKEKSDGKECCSPSGPSYEERPYCLRFTLEKPELEKLGLEPKAFSKMDPFTATVVIEPITIRDNESKTTEKYNQNSNKSVEFQIMKISLGEMAAAPASLAAAIDDADKTRKKVK